jgi:hypothetical protein
MKLRHKFARCFPPRLVKVQVPWIGNPRRNMQKVVPRTYGIVCPDLIQRRSRAIKLRAQILEIAGICWECHGVDVAYFADPTAWSRCILTTYYYDSWRAVRQGCTLCDELKNMLLDQVPRRTDGPQQQDDIRLQSRLCPTGGSSCTPNYLELEVYSDKGRYPVVNMTPTHIFGRKDTELHDLSLVKSWIAECEEKHVGGCQELCPYGLPLRVMDCASRTLCHIEPSTPYVALSYVWGSASSGVIKSSTIPQDLPKTIEDAMYVALQLGMPHLWVDRYCIDQDSIEEKRRLISKMDVIYRGAVVTIVAASGTSPNDGLAGVNGTPYRKPYRYTETSTGLSLTSLVGFENELRGTVWQSRAWTYQEFFLSRPRLIFTDTQMHFQCDAMNGVPSFHTKAIIDPPPVTSLRHDVADLRLRVAEVGDPRQEQTMATLYDCLTEFYPRNISMAEDIVKAFLGILNAVDIQNASGNILATHIHGLPVFYSSTSSSIRLQHSDESYVLTPAFTFVISLCWMIEGKDRTWNTPHPRTDLYPSWSWASVRAHRHYQYSGEIYFFPGSAYQASKDITIWITSNNGERVKLDEYISRLGNDTADTYTNKTYIRSWVAAMPSTAEIETTKKTLERKYAGFPDYPLHQPSDEIIAIHLASTLASPDMAFDGCLFLVAEKVDETTWRRVGLSLAYLEEAESRDPRECLRTVDLAAEWGGMRDDWQWRTICLV